MRHFETTVHDSAERVFARLADLRSYHEWLPEEGAYHGTSEISPGPIAPGTTYVETDPMGVRHGQVTALEQPTHLAFSQPMTMRPAALGSIGIEAGYEISAHGEHVHVRRSVEFTPAGPVRLVWPIVRRMFVKENERIMDALSRSGRAG